jgi:hypothetical protein
MDRFEAGQIFPSGMIRAMLPMSGPLDDAAD